MKRELLNEEYDETDVKERRKRRRAVITTEIAKQAAYLVDVKEYYVKDVAKILSIS